VKKAISIITRTQ